MISIEYCCGARPAGQRLSCGLSYPDAANHRPGGWFWATFNEAAKVVISRAHDSAAARESGATRRQSLESGRKGKIQDVCHVFGGRRLETTMGTCLC
jgi:hypothetical protein